MYLILGERIALCFNIPVSVTEIHANKEIVVVIINTTKKGYTWNITRNTKVLQPETRSLSGGDHCWFKRGSTSKNRPVTRDIIIIIIIIIKNHSHST